MHRRPLPPACNLLLLALACHAVLVRAGVHNMPQKLSTKTVCASPQCAGVLLFKSAGEYSVPVLLQQLLHSLEVHSGAGAKGSNQRLR